MTRQYIGARYVPKFADPIEWDSNRAYEGLTIVTHLGSSYTSKKPIPVGVDINDREYWVLTSNFNAQLAEYKQELEEYKQEVNKLDINLSTIITPLMFGAMGDGVSDDTTAIRDFFNACIGGKVGYIPSGTYLVSEPIMVNMVSPNTKNIVVFGSGTYKSTIKSIYNGSRPCFIFETTDSDSYHIVLSDFGFSGDTDGILFSLGDETDLHPIGNINFTNMFFGNSNTNKSEYAKTSIFNYVFDSVFTNCVFVGNASDRGYGYALDLRRCVFCNFIGGSYSNAKYGIYFSPTSGSQCCKFTGIDIENVEYGIRCESPYVMNIDVDTVYFDIWHPLLPTPSVGEYAVSIFKCAIEGFRIKNAFYARTNSPSDKGAIDYAYLQNTYIGESDWCFHSTHAGNTEQFALPTGFWSNVKFLLKTTKDGAEYRTSIVVNKKDIVNTGTNFKFYVGGSKIFDYRVAVNATAVTLNTAQMLEEDVKSNTVIEMYTQR